MRRIAAPEPVEAKGATDTTWWGFEHRCGGEWRVMGTDMGWADGGRSVVECQCCGGALTFAPVMRRG